MRPVTDFDLVILGDANPDLILTGDVVPRFGQAEQVLGAARLTVGGSGAITACAAARLGLSVALCGVVGDDHFGSFMRDELGARGVDLAGLDTDSALPTGLTVVLSRPGDRASLTHPGTIAALHAGLVDRDLLRAARHVHVSQYFMQDALRPDLPALFDEAHASGATTSVDPNADPSGEWDGGLRDLLARVDVFLPNAAEALAIAGQTDLDGAARALARLGTTVIVKDGSYGALAARAGYVIRSPAVDGSEIVDATGAGDCFDAGFITAHLAGESLEQALRVANACGALSTRALGGVEAQPTMQEVLRLLGGPLG